MSEALWRENQTKDYIYPDWVMWLMVIESLLSWRIEGQIVNTLWRVNSLGANFTWRKSQQGELPRRIARQEMNYDLLEERTQLNWMSKFNLQRSFRKFLFDNQQPASKEMLVGDSYDYRADFVWRILDRDRDIIGSTSPDTIIIDAPMEFWGDPTVRVVSKLKFRKASEVLK